MEEGGVAHHAEDHLIGDTLTLEGLCHAHTGGEAAAHADAHVHAVQRRCKAQGVAADVTGDHVVLVLAEGIEEAAVGAAGAQCRRTLGDSHIVHGLIVGLLAQHTLAHQLGVQLVHHAGLILAGAGDACGLDLILHEGLQLFDDIQRLHLGGEVADEVHGQGVGQTQLQEGSTLGEHFLGVLVGNGSGDNAHLAVAQLHLVEAIFKGAGAAVLLQLLKSLLHQRMVLESIGGGADELTGVAGIGLGGHLGALTELHETLGVAHAGGGAVQHGRIELLGDLAGQLHEVLALLRIAGLHHCHLGKTGIVTVVLLVLRGVAAGVIGGDDDVAAANAHVGCGEQGVGSHVETHHLHGGQCAGTGHGGAVGHFRTHLLVGSPLAVDSLAILGQVFKDLGAGRTGVGRADLDTGFIDAACGSLVAGHQMFHVDFPPFCFYFFCSSYI